MLPKIGLTRSNFMKARPSITRRGNAAPSPMRTRKGNSRCGTAVHRPISTQKANSYWFLSPLPHAMRIGVLGANVLASLTLGLPNVNAAPASNVNAREFLETHCYDCHDADTQKGKFRMDNLTALEPAEAAKKWGRILSRLEAGEMPPPKKPRPPQPQITEVLSRVKVALAEEAKARRGEGRTRIRRLNRLEYENTVRDLLGITTPLQDLLPEDDLADGFDTASAALSISPVHIQRYMEAAETALRAAIVRGARPEVVKRTLSFSDDKEQKGGSLTHPNNKPMIHVRDGSLHFFSEPHIEVPIRSCHI